MRKLPYCPRCKIEGVERVLTSGRKNKFRCEDRYTCRWESKAFIPPVKPIKTTKTIRVYNFSGWGYEVYDGYGQHVIYSKSYPTREEAIEAMKKNLANGKDKPYGPYTGIMWPRTVEVEGEIFK